MSEYAEGSIEIEASAGDVMDVISDFEAYPEWAEVEGVEVRRRGDWGHGTEVAFVVDVPVLGHAEYTLSYVYAPGDAGVSWTTKEAREVGDAWAPFRSVATWYLWRSLDPLPLTY